ncbi:hypothetical protein O3P69_010566 [Scylla paramamosain]|uniref:Uncharacterized protein n=1 Tax=Scylla paramamosain TaxID=85552 RepID=A0AAW0TET7_SCYPA
MQGKVCSAVRGDALQRVSEIMPFVSVMSHWYWGLKGEARQLRHTPHALSLSHGRKLLCHGSEKCARSGHRTRHSTFVPSCERVQPQPMRGQLGEKTSGCQ